jgi:hypothetical protein
VSGEPRVSSEFTPPDLVLLDDFTYTKPHIEDFGRIEFREHTVPAGTRCWRYKGATYGVCAWDEMPVSFTGHYETPFLGVPRDLLRAALKTYEEAHRERRD